MNEAPKPYFNSPKLKGEVYPVLTPHFREINMNMGNKLKLFYLKASLIKEFDDACIKFIRIAVYEMILKFKERKIGDFEMLSISKAFGYKTVEDYAKNGILKMGTNASGIIMSFVPYLLRCEIDTYILDAQNGDKIALKENIPMIEDLNQLKYDDDLNLHQMKLKLLYKKGHYEMISDIVDIYYHDYLEIENAIV